MRWNAEVDDAARNTETQEAERQALIEQGLTAAIDRLTEELGPDRAEWRHGRVHASELPHMLASAFDLPAVERPGGFGSLNATGANFRRIIDLADPDRSVASNAPGQSAQPGSPYYGNLAENLGSGRVLPVALHARGGRGTGRASADAAAGGRLSAAGGGPAAQSSDPSRSWPSR